MAEAKARDAWRHTASVCHALARVHGVRGTSVDSFDPFSQSEGPKLTKAAMAAWVNAEGARLPKTLPKEEILKRWEDAKCRLDQEISEQAAPTSK